MDTTEGAENRVPLPVTEPPGTSSIVTSEFAPLTSTVLVQQIQAQLKKEDDETENNSVTVLENIVSKDNDDTQTDQDLNVSVQKTEEEADTLENSEITQQQQSNITCSSGENEIKNQEKIVHENINESKIDEITDTANIVKFSSTPFVEPCETNSCSDLQNSQSNKNYKNNNNDGDDHDDAVQCINNKNKVAEKQKEEGNEEKKDILEYLVTFSDSAENQKHLEKKESEGSEKPPIPLPTYLWEDLKKAKEQGAYPWTHLYKRKFDPDDPVVFSTFPKKTSPKISKKVRIQDETLNTGSTPCLFDNLEKLETAFDKEEAQREASPAQPSASGNVSPPSSPKSILKRSHDEPTPEDSQAVAAGSSKAPKLKERLKSFNENIKSMTHKQMEKFERAKRHIKKIPLSGKEIVFHDKQKILRLKRSPKSGKHEFVSYLEKQDSDDTVEIVVLDDSPSNARKNENKNGINGVPTPEEIIELPTSDEASSKLDEIKEEDQVVPENSANEEEKSKETEPIKETTPVKDPEQVKETTPIKEPEPVKETTPMKEPSPLKDSTDTKEPAIDDDVELNFTEQTVPQIIEPPVTEKKIPPPKAPRKQKGHIYEDIDDPVKMDPLMIDMMGGAGMKESLKIQDQLIFKELKQKSEEEEDTLNALTSEVKPQGLLAPISSIDSTSSDEERDRRNTLPALVEESDTGLSDIEIDVKKDAKVESPIIEAVEPEKIESVVEASKPDSIEMKSEEAEKEVISTEKEPDTEKVTENIKEDVKIDEKPESLPVPSEKIASRWSAMSDHEYEPIGQPDESKPAPPSPDVQMSAQEFQLQLEDRFFNQPSSSPQAKTPNPDVVITAPSFDENARPGSSAEAPEPEKRKKSFMENAQEQGRIFQRKLSSQADSIKTKFSNLKKSKAEPETIEEPKEEVVEITTETIETSTVPKKNRFQKPDFTKLKGHLPEFKRPDMPKLKKPNFEKIKAMKRPSFDRPRMPDIPKMDFNKHIQSMKKLGRSKSVKEESASEQAEEAQEVPVEPEIEPTGSETLPTKKKKFDIDFRTYPRMITNKFKKSKKPEQVPSVQKITPILKPRAKGGKKELDTESGQFTEYNKDIDLDRETSVERRMRVHLEKAIEEYRQIEEEEKQTKQESLPRKKKGKKTIPQPESFDSREFDFNQNEMDSEGASKASTQEIQDIIQRSQQRQFGRTDTQSLQSGDRRGVLEEIDDDQFFLRKKGISEDNIQMGEYISSAIREGLMDPVNVLAQMGQFDDYQLDEDEIRYLQEIEKQGSDFQLELDEKLLPYKPGRRQKKQSSEEISDDQQGKWEPIKDIDEDSIELSNRDFSRFVPPTPPKRRKKRNAPLPKTQNSKNLNGYEELQNLPHQQEVNVYRQEQTFAVPLAKAESGDSFIPVPAARRSRSRSQSVLKDENKAFNVIEELSEIPGYAVIKKDPPPRPPAPQSRRSKSTRSHERPFNTMPRLGNHESTPERPARNYSTIIPDRPPRKPTTEHEKSATPYEEISDTNDEVVKKLISGEVVSKMKDRPLPAPPRPPREKGRKSVEPPKDDDQPKPDDDENQDDHKGGSAVRGILETADSFTSNEYKIEEVDAWCQTDPLPDDFQLEELEITDDMRTITPTMYRNQETDQRDAHMHVLERFSRPETPSIEQELQRIREGRPSSRHSITASRTPSRPTTPALVYVERKISTPLLNNEEQIEASLTAHQVEIDFDEETGNVIVTGLVADKPEPIAQVQERTEEDILKSLEAEIIRASEPENEIVAVKLAPIESQPEEQRPVEEPIIEPTRAPIRYQPEIEPEIESVIQPEEPQKEPEPTVVVHQVEPAIPTLPQQTPQVQSEPIQPQQPTLQQLSPDQPLHLSNLSVDRLSVNELQASKISVSELDSSTINSREIQCQSGNLNMRSIEIPPGVIEEIVERVSRVQREQFADRQSPIISIPPPSFYQLSSEPQQQQQQQEQPQLPVEEPVAPPRRSRQVPTTPVEDAPSADQPSILSLTGQLASACGSELSRQGSNLLNYLRSFKKDQNRRDVHFVLFVLIIIIAGLFMIGMDHTDRTVHHHHWDFFNPPRNGDHK